MNESDILDNIHALKESQRVAWQQLAGPSLTAFERCELRKQLQLSGAELEYYLEMMSERLRFRGRLVEDVGAGFGIPDFRTEHQFAHAVS